MRQTYQMMRQGLWRHVRAFVLGGLMLMGGFHADAAEAEWKQIPLDESDLDLSLLLPESVSIGRLEKQISDNHITLNRYIFNSAEGIYYHIGLETVFFTIV